MIGASGMELPLVNEEWRPVAGPRDLHGLALLVAAVDADVVPEVIIAAEAATVPVIVVVDELRPWALSDLLLKYSCIRNLITRDQVEDWDFARTAAEVRQASQPGYGFAIGSAWAMPDDPDEYEARRYLSLNSASMAPFLADLRAALGQMARRRPSLPWDPTDAVPPPALDKDGRLKGGGPFNLSDLVEHAREENARAVLTGPEDLGEWKSLPPPFLILGDSGTGKSLLARLIHDVLTEPATQDGRRGQLVEVAVAGMDDRNFDYEMFGATSGVWNEVPYRVGEATQAAYGTLFLDELGDMPEVAQTRLLRFFNDLRIKIPGTSQPFFSYMHIVAATNREVDHLVSLGRFRNDLLARFRVRVTLPQLAERDPNEKKRLIDFVAQHPRVNPAIGSVSGDEVGRLVSHISSEAMEALLTHDYRDGNFRELEYVVHNAIEKARRSNRRSVELEDLVLRPPKHRPDSVSRVVQVKALPLTPVTVEVQGLDELHRLADRLEAVLLQHGSDYFAVVDGVTYRATRP
uniref:Nitrogen regulation protein NtrC n=1 Tax=uncultured bacterium A1Q1_fos_1000 TaxID=1256536 RepID=L7VR43_9BACT|nr:nitrogen regulation protein NtrC [uncultured bacterium A1Q1_fos_1000]